MIGAYILKLLATMRGATAGLGAPGSAGVWPVKTYRGPNGLRSIWPSVSDGFERPGPDAKRNGKGHLGVDVMFRRTESGDFDRPEYTRHFFCPSDVVEAVAVAPGKVWSVQHDNRNGGVVKISHGSKHLTVYRHLARMDVKAGQLVRPGDVLGIVGHAPSAGTKGINHLHFEIWDTSIPGPNTRLNRSVDPEPWLRWWDRR